MITVMRDHKQGEILEIDQKLNVVILDFDDDKSRIQLGVKQLETIQQPLQIKLRLAIVNGFE